MSLTHHHTGNELRDARNPQCPLDETQFIQEHPEFRAVAAVQPTYLFVEHDKLPLRHGYDSKKRAHVQRFSGSRNARKVQEHSPNKVLPRQSFLSQCQSAERDSQCDKSNLPSECLDIDSSYITKSWPVQEVDALDRYCENFLQSVIASFSSRPNTRVYGNGPNRTLALLLSSFFEEEFPQVFATSNYQSRHINWITSHVTKDPGAMFALLSYSGALKRSQVLRKDHNINTGFIEHWQIVCKIKAVEVLGNRMNNVDDATDIVTIYSIACLLAADLLNGEKSALEVNLRGLRSLMTLRNGFEGFPDAVIDFIVRTCQMSEAFINNTPQPVPPDSKAPMSQ